MEGTHSMSCPPARSKLFPPAGGYRKLLSFQKSEIVFDLTFRFCRRFLKPGDRTIGQMEQAARSGKQNIAEGSKAAATAKDTEIHLTNVALASLEELLLDYEDYLRVRNLPQWEKDSPQALFMREQGKAHNADARYFLDLAESRDAEAVANMAICLIHQARFLLQRQIQSLGERFLAEGGFRERMTSMRRTERERQQGQSGA